MFTRQADNLIYSGIILIAAILFLMFFPKPKYTLPGSMIKKWNTVALRAIKITLIICIVLLPLNIQRKVGSQQITKKTLNIAFVFDVSLSEAADDIKPSRFEAAKSSLISLIDQLTGYEITTVMFSGIPFVYTPLSDRTAAIQAKLKPMKLGDFPPTMDFIGTALGDALLLAVNQLSGTAAENKSGIIVLITDGDSNKGMDPLQAVDLAAQHGIQVFTLGIGDNNFLIGHDKGGNPIITTINIDLLKKIAEKGSGKFRRVTSENDLPPIFDELKNIVKSQEIQDSQDIYQPIKPWLIVLVIILLIITKGLGVYSLRGMSKSM